jgi:nicotinamidase/pyrazinamidase
VRALIIVDMQKDFMPGGALGVERADRLVPLHNQLMEKFDLVVATKDWHPKNHISFAINHPGKKEGDVVETDFGKQVLWPVHCVHGTDGAEFAMGLNKMRFDEVFYKGVDPKVDSYSTFFDDARHRSTGLEKYLKKHEVDEIFFAGVATDYCVLYSVHDALELGFSVSVIEDGCGGIDLHPGDIEKAYEEIRAHGAHIVQSGEVLHA